MPRLIKLPNDQWSVADQRDDADRSYLLSAEGLVFLTQLLRVGENDEIRPRDFQLMLDRGWVTPRAETKPKLHEITPVQKVAPEPESVAPAGETRPPLSRRTRGREVALQVLYLLEQNASVDTHHVEQFLARRLRDPKLIAFTRSIVDGVREHLKHLDALISEVAENWRIDRMAAIDRNILRVGAFEMLYCPDVPAKVAINEALELAKRYSTAQSSRFVNGILDRLQSAKPESPGDAADRPAEPPAPTPAPDAADAE